MLRRHHIWNSSLASFALLAAALVPAAQAKADHNYSVLRARADAIFHEMEDLNGDLRQSFSRSRLYGEMVIKANRIQNKASYLYSMCYQGSPCLWSDEMARMDALIHDLESLVTTAQYYSSRGLDPPISWSVAHTRQHLKGITKMVHEMRAAVEVAHVHPGHGHGHGHGNGHGHGHGHPYNGHAGHGHGDDLLYRGSRGGSVRLNDDGVTIGRGGLSVRIPF